MKISEDRRGMAGGVDLVALWETGDGLGGAPVFKGKAKPGANRWVRRAGALSMNWAAVAAGLMVLTLVPFLAQEGSRPPALNEGSPLDGVLGVDPFVAEAGAGAMSPGFPSDGSDVERAQDPSLMVLGPERPGVATAAAPASAPTGPAPKAAGATDWAAALKNAVRTAAPAAVKRAGLPSPSARLAGALKAIAAGAGSSASKASSSPSEALRLSAPSSKDLLSAFKASDSLQLRRSEPLLRSLARGGPVTSGAQGGVAFPSSLPSSARPAGGSASENLRDAVSAFGSPSANGQGGAGPAVFDGGKGPGANPAGVAKAPGESLEFMRKKMEMEKEMDLKYAKRKYNELGRQEMLDKVNAESAAKMKETVAGKMIDGAFGLAQKAMGGEGGGKGGGGGESAVEAHEKAEAARRKYDGRVAALRGEAGHVSQQGGLAEATGDEYSGKQIAPHVKHAGLVGSQAAQANEAASQSLAQAGGARGGAIQEIGQVNSATGQQIQAMQNYTGAQRERINRWEIESFSPGGSKGNMLEVQADGKSPLSKAQERQQKAKQAEQVAAANAASAPPGVSPDVKAVEKIVRDPKVQRQSKANSTITEVPVKLGGLNGNVAGTNADGQGVIALANNATGVTAAAREAAATALNKAEGVRGGLKSLDPTIDATEGQLATLSGIYRLNQFINPSAAEAAKGKFIMIKEAVRGPFEAQAGQLPAVQETHQQAQAKLGLK